MQDDVAVRIQFDFGLIHIGVAAFDRSLEPDFAFVITKTSGVVLRHRHSESTLQSSGIAAGRRISFLPTNGLHSFLQYLDGCVRIVGKESFFHLRHQDHCWATGFDGDFRSRLLNVQQAKLHRIDPHGFRHFIHHLFPTPLEFLLHVAAGWPRGHGVGSIVVADLLPIGNHVEVELRAASASASSAALARVDEELALARRDVAVLFCTHFEFLDVLGLDLHVRQFLVFRER